MTSKCAHCANPSVFRVEEAGEHVRYCTSCLDKRYPELMLGKLTQALVVPKVQDGTCPNCAWTETKLGDTGMVGCPLCYEAFGHDVWTRFGIERNQTAWAKLG